MADTSPYSTSVVEIWSTDTQLVHGFERPVVVSEAVLSTLMEAVDHWPELSRSPPVFEFVDVDKLDGLFKTRAVEETGHLPSVEFLSSKTHLLRFSMGQRCVSSSNEMRE